jgi:hypothetical protein
MFVSQSQYLISTGRPILPAAVHSLLRHGKLWPMGDQDSEVRTTGRTVKPAAGKSALLLSFATLPDYSITLCMLAVVSDMPPGSTAIDCGSDVCDKVPHRRLPGLQARISAATYRVFITRPRRTAH